MYRIMFDFEDRADAESCIDVIAYWENPVYGIPYDLPEGEHPFDPPEKSFAVHSIKEVQDV